MYKVKNSNSQKINVADRIVSRVLIIIDSILWFILKNKDLESLYSVKRDTYNYIYKIDADGIHHSYIFQDNNKVQLAIEYLIKERLNEKR